MCATVCPSQALFFGTKEQIEQLRPRSKPVNEFKFGRETVRTRVMMMVPRQVTAEHIDVTNAMDATTGPRRIALHVLPDAGAVDPMMDAIFVAEKQGVEL